MSAGSDELWVDMTQFDARIADGVWDGTARDPDAPPWYRDLRSLIHRARGPAEAHELIDEPLVVNTMHRVRLGSSIARLPRRSGVRTVGRVLAMKAAALTTTGVIGVAAAAATTGIVATVAATVVVPVVKDHVVVPVINTITPAVIPAEVASPPTTDVAQVPFHLASPAAGGQLAALPPVEIQVPTVDVPAEPASAEAATDPAPSEPAVVPTTPEDAPVEPTVVAEAPVEEVPPVVDQPVTEEPVATDPPPVTEDPPVTDEPVDEPAATDPPPVVDPPPAVHPPPAEDHEAPAVDEPETPAAS
jgi:hypothetical protein